MTKNVILRLKKLFAWIELLPFVFSPSKLGDGKFVIVTGSSSSHYKSLCQFLSSVSTHEPVAQVIVFDLGLKEEERKNLFEEFSSIELRHFEFSRYPDYFSMDVNAGEYAWKPVIVSDVVHECRCCVCWMDAGNVVTKPLVWLRKITGAVGMYSPHSSGYVVDWTHPGTLESLKASDCVLQKNNLNGACVAIDYRSSEARDLVKQWKECSFDRDCIAPKGSSRENHRQDQAVLSVLAHQSGITKRMPNRLYGFKTHQDIE